MCKIGVCCSEHTIEDIVLLQRSPVWDAVADDFIDRRAAGFGKVVVVERRGVAISCYAGLNRKNKLVIIKTSYPSVLPDGHKH